jgi:hypothetical protein
MFKKRGEKGVRVTKYDRKKAWFFQGINSARLGIDPWAL